MKHLRLLNVLINVRIVKMVSEKLPDYIKSEMLKNLSEVIGAPREKPEDGPLFTSRRAAEPSPFPKYNENNSHDGLPRSDLTRYLIDANNPKPSQDLRLVRPTVEEYINSSPEQPRRSYGKAILGGGLLAISPFIPVIGILATVPFGVVLLRRGLKNRK